MSDVIELPSFLSALASTLVRRRRPILRAVQLLGKQKDDDVASLGACLEDTVAKFPDRPALKWEGGELSYREVNTQTNRYAHHFARSGVKKGDVVAVFLDNRPELICAVAAVVKVGAIAAMINTHQRRDVLEHSMKLVRPKLVLVGEELVEAFEEVRERLELPAEAVRFVPDAGEAEAPQGYVDLRQASADESIQNPPTTRTVLRKDPAFYIFTSGTTGLPKAAIMGQTRWIGAGVVFGQACMALTEDDVVYAPLPLYHNQGLTMAWSSAVQAGAALAIRRKLSVSHFWEDCERYGATAFAYIGEMTRYLLNAPVTPAERRNRVRCVCGVGLRADVWFEFKQRFGIDEVFEFYGASELNISFMNLLNLDRTVGFCPAPWKLARYDVDAGEVVRAADGLLQEAEKGEAGLLLAKVTDKFRFEGYTDADASEQKLIRDAFEQGDVWVNSGDLMRNVGFGHVQFVDRVGDTFRWKSENVATGEVERELNMHPAVEESCVFGVELPNAVGRAGMAAVVSSGKVEFDVGSLLSHLRRELPGYAVPVFLRQTDSLQVTGTFKHRKVALRKEGFDPVCGDPLWVLLPKAEAYVPVTADLYQEIRAGKYRF